MSKTTIKRCLSPGISSNQGISISGARAGLKLLLLKAKSEFDVADALMYYVECGARYTCDYGDIDERLYNTLMVHYDKCAEHVRKSKMSISERKLMVDRAKIVRDKCQGIGWGFADGLNETYANIWCNIGCD